MKMAIAALVAAALAALCVRVVLAGRAALDAGDAATDPRAKISAYEAAARWYLPLAPHVGDAYTKLRALTKQPDTELAAWRAIRSAALATQSLWTPHADDLADANAAIARLSARDAFAGSGAGDTTAAREAYYRDRLVRDLRPRALVPALGILLWVIGAIALAKRGMLYRPALGAVVAGVALWAVGLYLA